MLYIGIDPGAKGAIAIMDEYRCAQVFDCPGALVDIGTLLKKNFDPRVKTMACIEDPSEVIRWKTPGGGVKVIPNTKMVRNCGQWEGMLAILGIPFEYVKPKKWQKLLDNPVAWENKRRSYDMAARIFPGLELTGPKGGIKDGRCDALLIAEWLRREVVRTQGMGGIDTGGRYQY